MDEIQQALLVEANENLVVAVLKAHVQRADDEKKIREITHLAGLDVLTGLPNRMILLDRLSHAIVNANRSGDCLAVLFIDLNKFKLINDSLGHAAGDQVLKIAADCMTKSVRDSDTVTRQGGDEFIILLEQVCDLQDVTQIVEKIFTALSTPTRIGSHMVRLTASVGVSLFPGDGDDAETLISQADSAMYRAKRSDSHLLVFASAAETDNVGEPGTSRPHSPQILSGEKEQRHAHRRTADEELVNAKLAAQELQTDAEQALRRQTKFMATLAHELRNPLAPIRNVVLLIEKAPPDSVTTKTIHGILDRQVIHMTKLLDDVFDMSRIATGKLRVELVPVDIVNVIRQAMEMVDRSVTSRRQNLVCTLPESAAKVTGDPVRLVQVFANLLDNAAKYTPEEGSIFVSVVDDISQVVITVTDTGIGITAEALPTVFDMFVQDSKA